MATRYNIARDFPDLTGQQTCLVIEYMKDLNPRRAALAVGLKPESAHSALNHANVKNALNHLLQERLEAVGIDAEWVLMQLVDNHLLARQDGNLSVSTKALHLIAQHCKVDAMAKTKVELSTNEDKDIMAALQRGRKRLGIEEPEGPDFFGPS